MSNGVLGDKSLQDAQVMRRMVWTALQEALSILGESSMKAVIYHLSKRGITINSIDSKEVEHVLYSLFGDGARVIISEMYRRLESHSSSECITGMGIVRSVPKQ